MASFEKLQPLETLRSALGVRIPRPLSCIPCLPCIPRCPARRLKLRTTRRRVHKTCSPTRVVPCRHRHLRHFCNMKPDSTTCQQGFLSHCRLFASSLSFCCRDASTKLVNFKVTLTSWSHPLLHIISGLGLWDEPRH